jgi:hypothetical protein
MTDLEHRKNLTVHTNEKFEVLISHLGLGAQSNESLSASYLIAKLVEMETSRRREEDQRKEKKRRKKEKKAEEIRLEEEGRARAEAERLQRTEEEKRAADYKREQRELASLEETRRQTEITNVYRQKKLEASEQQHDEKQKKDIVKRLLEDWQCSDSSAPLRVILLLFKAHQQQALHLTLKECKSKNTLFGRHLSGTILSESAELDISQLKGFVKDAFLSFARANDVSGVNEPVLKWINGQLKDPEIVSDVFSATTSGIQFVEDLSRELQAAVNWFFEVIYGQPSHAMLPEQHEFNTIYIRTCLSKNIIDSETARMVSSNMTPASSQQDVFTRVRAFIVNLKTFGPHLDMKHSSVPTGSYGPLSRSTPSRPCRFYKTEKGCFKGDCPFSHADPEGNEPQKYTPRRSAEFRRFVQGNQPKWPESPRKDYRGSPSHEWDTRRSRSPRRRASPRDEPRRSQSPKRDPERKKSKSPRRDRPREVSSSEKITLKASLPPKTTKPLNGH